jgi:hypothetical protein
MYDGPAHIPGDKLVYSRRFPGLRKKKIKIILRIWERGKFISVLFL